MSEIAENRVNPQIARPWFSGENENTAYLRCGVKSAFDIIGVGSGSNLHSTGTLKYENYLQVREHDRHESGHDSLRVRQVRPLLPRLYAPHSLESEKPSRTLPLETTPTSRNESHRLPAIALTRIIPSPYHPSRGFGVLLKEPT